MGVILKHIVLFAFTLFVHLVSMAQELPAIHKINGEKYYLHVVTQGNTLYAISKTYNVAIADIEKHNPVINTEGLKVNQTLLIPVTKENKDELAPITEQTANFITHKVQPKETLYAISKQYSTTLTALLKANPEVESQGLKEGMLIQVPVAKVEVKTPEHVAVAKPDSLASHIVGKGETLYSLSKRYNKSIDDITAANDGLPFGLKEGMAIRIPGTNLKNLTEVPNQENPSKIESRITKQEEPTTNLVKEHKPSSLHLALLLPFNPTFPDSANADEFKITEIQRIALNFYRGVKYAADSFTQSHPNLKLTVDVIDGGNDTSSINKIISTGRLSKAEVIIGPFYTDQFELVADHFRPSGVPVICPVPKPSKILFQRSNAVKTIPSETMQWEAIAKYLAHAYRDSNVIVVNSNKFQDQDNVTFFKSRLGKALGVPDTFLNDAVREIKLWDINRETLGMRLKDSGSYVLVVPSTDKVFVTKLLSGLYDFQMSSKGKFKFRIIGPEEWLKYEQDLEVSYLHKLNVTLPIENHLNFNDYRINRFFKAYQAAFKFEPNRYTLMGYDIGDYVLNQALHNKQEWLKSPERFQHQGLITDFYFQRVVDNSGVENQSVSLYEYEQYKLKRFAKWPIQEMK